MQVIESSQTNTDKFTCIIKEDLNTDLSLRRFDRPGVLKVTKTIEYKPASARSHIPFLSQFIADLFSFSIIVFYAPISFLS